MPISTVDLRPSMLVFPSTAMAPVLHSLKLAGTVSDVKYSSLTSFAEQNLTYISQNICEKHNS